MRFQAFALHLLLLGFPGFSIAADKDVANIGLIAEMETWEGKVVQSFISMALRDFYDRNWGFGSRIALHVRDSRGDSLHAIAAALDLLENVKVNTIIVPKISNDELFLATLADKAHVPLLSFASPLSLSQHHYVVQVAEDEVDEFYGIGALMKTNKWRSLVLLHEDSTDARLCQTYIHDIFQENHLDLAYRAAISLQVTDDQIISELHKLVEIKTSVFVVHLSPSLASRVFSNAKILGLMREGFVWIVTGKTMNFLDPQDPSFCESMQGVLGFRSYIPVSSKLQNLAVRWRRAFREIESSVKIRELNAVGRWAYDAGWLLAEAVEKARVQVQPSQNQIEASESRLNLDRIRVSDSGPSILSKISSSKFTGLAGELQFRNGRLVPEAYEILNITCEVERRVCFWTAAHGLTKDIHLHDNLSSYTLDPGFSLTASESSSVQVSGKSLRIGVPGKARFHELVGKNHDPKSNAVSFSGFCIDVFRAALPKLPYKILPQYISFESGNTTYADLIHQVHLQTFDAAVGDITILPDRFEYVDFTISYTEPGVGFMVKLNNDPWFFLKPLSPELWIVSACSFILMGSVVWLIEHCINEEFQGSATQQIMAILWFSISTLVFANRERLRSNASRFVLGLWFFVVLILTSSYIANLSSILTVAQFSLPKTHHIGYSVSSLVPRLMAANNLNFDNNRLRPYRYREDYYEALKRGSKNGGVDAIIEEIPYIKALVGRYPNKYAMVKSLRQTSGFGFAFPKGSPLAHDMSRAISELREEGKLSEMENKWFKNQSQLFSQESNLARLDPLKLEQFMGLFLINGTFEFIVMLIFFVVFVRERLLRSFHFLTTLAGGKLTFILRYFYPKTDDRIAGLEAT